MVPVIASCERAACAESVREVAVLRVVGVEVVARGVVPCGGGERHRIGERGWRREGRRGEERESPHLCVCLSRSTKTLFLKQRKRESARARKVKSF
jgi:hypothetical protein